MSYTIKLNRSGARAIMRSAEVQDDLERRAQLIAERAGDGFVADSHVGRNRARANVTATTTEARLAEANNRALTRALDAGK